jgi:cyclin-dependent kinase 12/13
VEEERVLDIEWLPQQQPALHQQSLDDTIDRCYQKGYRIEGMVHSQIPTAAAEATRSSSAAIVTPDHDPSDCHGSHFQHRWQDMTRTVAHYERLEQIGLGTYGQVYRARCLDTGRTVALKKMRAQTGKASGAAYWGMPTQLIREIKILKQLRHPNLLSMIEVVTSKGVEHLDPDDPIVPSSDEIAKKKRDKYEEDDPVALAREKYKGNLFLVLEYVTHDLTGLMDVAYQFTPVQIKCIFQQLLKALQFMHENKYVHRDIKSSNILLDSHFRLKLADFGLARSLEPPLLDQMEEDGGSAKVSGGQDLTNKVITLWYRPPEVLLGSQHYGCAVDVWSAGCILVELLSGKPLAAGKTELDQLNLVADLTGTPDDETWQYLFSLKKSRSLHESIPPAANELRDGERKPSKLRNRYGPNSTSKNKNNRLIPETALNLLEKLLEWDPRKRLTASFALQNRYFWTAPVPPENPAELGRIQVAADGHFHEFQTKQRRKDAKIEAEQHRDLALLKGASQEAAANVFDSVYMGIMQQVAQEGVHSVVVVPPPPPPAPASVDATEKDISNVKGDHTMDPPGRDENSLSRSEAKGSTESQGDRRGSRTDRERERSRLGDTKDNGRDPVEPELKPPPPPLPPHESDSEVERKRRRDGKRHRGDRHDKDDEASVNSETRERRAKEKHRRSDDERRRDKKSRRDSDAAVDKGSDRYESPKIDDSITSSKERRSSHKRSRRDSGGSNGKKDRDKSRSSRDSKSGEKRDKRHKKRHGSDRERGGSDDYDNYRRPEAVSGFGPIRHDLDRRDHRVGDAMSHYGPGEGRMEPRERQDHGSFPAADEGRFSRDGRSGPDRHDRDRPAAMDLYGPPRRERDGPASRGARDGPIRDGRRDRVEPFASRRDFGSSRRDGPPPHSGDSYGPSSSRGQRDHRDGPLPFRDDFGSGSRRGGDGPPPPLRGEHDFGSRRDGPPRGDYGPPPPSGSGGGHRSDFDHRRIMPPPHGRPHRDDQREGGGTHHRRPHHEGRRDHDRR